MKPTTKIFVIDASWEHKGIKRDGVFICKAIDDEQAQSFLSQQLFGAEKIKVTYVKACSSIGHLVSWPATDDIIKSAYGTMVNVDLEHGASTTK